MFLFIFLMFFFYFDVFLKKILSLFLCFLMTCFYAQQQNASLVFAIVWASVCLSVHLSHS